MVRIFALALLAVALSEVNGANVLRLARRSHLDCHTGVVDECNPLIHPELLARTFQTRKIRSRIALAEDDEGVITMVDEDNNRIAQHLRAVLGEDRSALAIEEANNKPARKLKKGQKLVRVKAEERDIMRAQRKCIAQFTAPANGVFRHWNAFDGNLYTYGDKGKFKSWGFWIEKEDVFPIIHTKYRGKQTKRTERTLRTQAFDRQMIFIQGRETASSYIKFAQAQLSTLNDIQRGKFLLKAQGLVGLSRDNSDLYQQFSKLSLTKQAKVRNMYYFAAATSLYPMLPHLTSYLTANPTADVLQLPYVDGPLIDPGATNRDELWSIFRYGVKFGMTSFGFDSTGGRGIYFALNGEQTKGDHGGKCLKCSVPGNLETVNVDSSTQSGACAMLNLMAAGFWSRGYSDDDPVEERVMISPSGKNLFTNPARAETLLARKLVVYKPAKLGDDDLPYVVDKGALDYNACRKC